LYSSTPCIPITTHHTFQLLHTLLPDRTLIILIYGTVPCIKSIAARNAFRQASFRYQLSLPFLHHITSQYNRQDSTTRRNQSRIHHRAVPTFLDTSESTPRKDRYSTMAPLLYLVIRVLHTVDKSVRLAEGDYMGNRILCRKEHRDRMGDFGKSYNPRIRLVVDTCSTNH
jgi:hypothetical protein